MPGILIRMLASRGGRVSLVCALLVLGAFGGGWQISAWRYGSKIDAMRASRAEAVASAVAAREQELRRRLLEQQRRAEEATRALSRRLQEVDDQRRVFEERLASKPETLIKEVFRDAENPFSADFVRMWNAGGVLDDASTARDHRVPGAGDPAASGGSDGALAKVVEPPGWF